MSIATSEPPATLTYAIARALRGHPTLVGILEQHIGGDAAVHHAPTLATEIARTLAARMVTAGWRPPCPERSCGRVPELVCEHRPTYEVSIDA